VRTIGWIAAVLLAAGWMATTIPGPTSEDRPGLDWDWRMTRDGWQRPVWMLEDRKPEESGLHPLIVGALELMLSTVALLAWDKDWAASRQKQEASPTGPPPPHTLAARSLSAGGAARSRESSPLRGSAG
jgi:hypothetical protein